MQNKCMKRGSEEMQMAVPSTVNPPRAPVGRTQTDRWFSNGVDIRIVYEMRRIREYWMKERGEHMLVYVHRQAYNLSHYCINPSHRLFGFTGSLIN